MRRLLLLLCCLLPLQAVAELRVTVSIKPIHSILAALMLESDAPRLLIEGEQNPFEFQPSEAQRQQMASSQLLLWVGPELETKLAPAIVSLPKGVRVLELLSNPGLKILPARHSDQQRDPWFWLDNRNITLLVNQLGPLLEELDPARAHLYARNRRTLLERLGRLDREYEYGYRGFKAGLGVQYYDTLHYFEQAYALKVLDQVSPSPQLPTSAEQLLRVRQLLQSNQANCLLTEAALPTPEIALLTAGTTARIGQLDSLGSGMEPGPDLYFQLMQANSAAIRTCLQGEGAEVGQIPPAEEPPPPTEALRFVLTDHLGRMVSNEELRGRFQILYFGYTFCPDICPTSLAVLTQALRLLGERAEQFQPWFITIDPERDTQEVLKRYVTYFDPRLIGLTGSREMIDRLAAHFKVKYEKVLEPGKDPSMYLMDHSASLYLLGPDGRFITKFIHGISPQQLRDELLKVLP